MYRFPSKVRIPKYRHHKAKDRAVVTIDGRDYYLGKYGSPESKAEYDALVAQWMANGRRTPLHSPEGFSPPPGAAPAVHAPPSAFPLGHMGGVPPTGPPAEADDHAQREEEETSLGNGKRMVASIDAEGTSRGERVAGSIPLAPAPGSA